MKLFWHIDDNFESSNPIRGWLRLCVNPGFRFWGFTPASPRAIHIECPSGFRREVPKVFHNIKVKCFIRSHIRPCGLCFVYLSSRSPGHLVTNESSREYTPLQRSVYTVYEVLENEFASAPSPKVLECE